MGVEIANLCPQRQQRKIKMNSADKCRENGWGPGTQLAGDEGYGETVIEITAVGEENILAKKISHKGEAAHGGESLWALSERDWEVVSRDSKGG